MSEEKGGYLPTTPLGPPPGGEELYAQPIEKIAESHMQGTKLYVPVAALKHIRLDNWYGAFDWYAAELDTGEPVLVLRGRPKYSTGHVVD